MIIRSDAGSLESFDEWDGRPKTEGRSIPVGMAKAGLEHTKTDIR